MALRIYLSGPMDNCDKKEMNDWRDFVKGTWPEYRYHDPCRRAWGTDVRDPKLLVELDKFDIASSNVLLANVWKYSAGTMMEIPYAHSLGKLVVVVNNLGRPISPWVGYHSTIVVSSICGGMEWLEDQLRLDRKFNQPDQEPEPYQV